MKKSSNKSNKKKQKISTVSNPIKCKHAGCREPALSLSKYCWDHMPDEEKANYKKKIEDWNKNGKSLESFIIASAYLEEVNLSGAKLLGANLFKADLLFANLSDAFLFWTNLSETDLGGANLSKAHFLETNLENVLLDGANLSNAENLRISSFSSNLTKIEKQRPDGFCESYLIVKNYFLRMGLYDDASEAAYREKVLQRLSFFQIWKREAEWRYKNPKKVEGRTQKTLLEKVLLTIKYIILNPRLFVKPFLKTFSSLIWSALCGYGEKAWRPVVSVLVIIAGYGLFYWYANVLEPAQDLLGSMYFSIVTFTTLGYGDIKPIEYNNLFRFICSSEAFIGAFMIALFVWTLARRGAAR